MTSEWGVYNMKGVIVLGVEIVSVVKVLSFYDRITPGDLRVSGSELYS